MIESKFIEVGRAVIRKWDHDPYATDEQREGVRHGVRDVHHTLDRMGVFASRPCCLRRARARYWRIARGYFGLGLALGVAVGMLLGAASKVCAP